VQLVIESEGDLTAVGSKIIEYAGEQKIWLFNGEMGAGKTTLIKAIAAQFGVEDMVQSPTFSIVNEYRNQDDEVFYHFDFYRIRNENEALDIGVEEYFDSGNFCFIEWPQKIPNLIPEEYLQIELEITSETTRKIYLDRHDK